MIRHNNKFAGKVNRCLDRLGLANWRAENVPGGVKVLREDKPAVFVHNQFIEGALAMPDVPLALSSIFGDKNTTGWRALTNEVR